MNTQIIQKKLDALPEALKQEVLHYIEFLSRKQRAKSRKKKLAFDWEGGLSDLKDQYTSVELQHKISGWR